MNDFCIIFFVGILSPQGTEGDNNCNVIMAISSFAFFMANVLAYVLLWVRQKFLYKSPLVSRINSKVVQFFSWISLILLIIGGLVNWLVFVLTITYKNSEIGCIKRIPEAQNSVYYLIQLSSFISHLVLFFLLCYPLHVYWKSFHKNKLTKQNKNNLTKSKITSLSRAAIMTLLTCSSSDLIAMTLVTQLFPGITPKSITGVVFDCSLAVHIITIVATNQIQTKNPLKLQSTILTVIEARKR